MNILVQLQKSKLNRIISDSITGKVGSYFREKLLIKEKRPEPSSQIKEYIQSLTYEEVKKISDYLNRNLLKLWGYTKREV